MSCSASLKQDEWPPETLSQYASFPRWLWRIDNLLCQILGQLSCLNRAKVCVPFLAMWRDDPCAVDGILCCIPGTWLVLTAVTYHRYPPSCSYEAARSTQENFRNSFTLMWSNKMCRFIRRRENLPTNKLISTELGRKINAKNNWNWSEWKSPSFTKLYGWDVSLSVPRGLALGNCCVLVLLPFFYWRYSKISSWSTVILHLESKCARKIAMQYAVFWPNVSL